MSILLSKPIVVKNEWQRAKLTASCRDTEYIPKVKNAGTTLRRGGKEFQVMHNGVLVEAGGYYGDWMTSIIKDLKGHHEPQEEKVFYEVLKRLRSRSTMIELGAFWAYYSIWFNKQIKRARNVCCEPDPNNLNVGKRNAGANGIKSIDFYQAAAASKDGEIIELQMDSDPAKSAKVPVMSVDGIMSKTGWEKLDVLHVDVQGHELAVLEGARKTIKRGALRFLVLSTHHYVFSRSPLTHNECLSYIDRLGGHIVSSHTVLESYSGDGLIVASFDSQDSNFKVEVSANRADNTLFRPYEEDIAILAASAN